MPTTLEDLVAHLPASDFAPTLAPGKVEEFRARGFTFVERLTSDEELAWLADIYDRLFAERATAVPGTYIDDLMRPYDRPGADAQPQIIMPELRFPQLRKSLFWRNGRQIAATLLGVETLALRGWTHMILKPARVGGSLPWHQDEAYWDPAFEYAALGCWMPLDAATSESGCMSFIPGSHRGDVRTHRHVGDDPAIHALYVEGVDARTAVEVPVAAGGAVFHHCRVLHCSGPNRSAQARRAWATEWQTEPVRRESPAMRPWVDDGKRAWESRNVKRT
jgi:ectoine hydroxylase-related dioxygenase (phytanoyl-CoA dioxygenase family)